MVTARNGGHVLVQLLRQRLLLTGEDEGKQPLSLSCSSTMTMSLCMTEVCRAWYGQRVGMRPLVVKISVIQERS